MADDSDDFLANFQRELATVDELANMVLRGHFVVERHLDEALCAIFFHPEKIVSRAFNFERKVQLARAMSMRTNDHKHWEAILALSQLRNEIAHKNADGKRTKLLERAFECSKDGYDGNATEIQNLSESEMLAFVCATCSGFLIFVEEDFLALRKHIDALDAQLHPDKARVPIKKVG